MQFLHKRLLTLELCVKHIYRCFAAFPGVDKSEQFFRVKRVSCTSPKRTEVPCAQRSRFGASCIVVTSQWGGHCSFFNFSYLFSEHLCILQPSGADFTAEVFKDQRFRFRDRGQMYCCEPQTTAGKLWLFRAIQFQPNMNFTSKISNYVPLKLVVIFLLFILKWCLK